MIERKRPIKQFRAKQAFGPYRKGDLCQPTGMYRDVLVRRGLIEEVLEVREQPPAMDRMVVAAQTREPTLTLPKKLRRA